MSVQMNVSGLDGVMDMLDALDDRQILDAARKGLQSGLQDIRGAAVMLCPVDTGDLRKSIKTRTRIEGEELVGEVYVGKEYGVFVEMGTGPKGEQNHEGVNPEWLAKTTYKPEGWVWPTGEEDKEEAYRFTLGQPARPFLYPAYKSQKHKVNEKIAAAVIREAQKGG
ncbi:MAG: HK97 gp10 family phage protein [Clostridia bacterium]|nr:HK97 gp10 family phage protein [Clostridia bacterium]